MSFPALANAEQLGFQKDHFGNAHTYHTFTDQSAWYTGVHGFSCDDAGVMKVANMPYLRIPSNDHLPMQCVDLQSMVGMGMPMEYCGLCWQSDSLPANTPIDKMEMCCAVLSGLRA